ncbi:C10 family peptidase (plasmid) [Tenacibaculum maritimum]|nr:C10 family peptidase [Tenacibaculum maritimum]MDB0600236.1 C10 family peptidase [Tenacibaculum maritimum]MDB0613664.1 C10 family peptidase [Tenacibaculum maritimum]
MKHKNLLIFSIFSLFIFFSCQQEDIISSSEIKGIKNINNSENKIKNAISFLNTNFVPQSNLRAKGLGQKENLDEYSEKEIEIIHELKEEDGTPFLKLICFKPSGYALISNLENIPNPPVLFYSQEKFDKESVSPALISYVQEFILTHSKDSRAPSDNEDGDGDGAWDDGRDTNTGDPRDSPYYYKENILNTWAETIEKGPLLSTFWQQGSPYNKTIEKFEGKKTLVGCVAIAVGQIMNYNRKNSLKNYDWDKINVINGNPVTTDHLPNFLRDVAEGVRMDYGTTGSSSDLGKALSYFGKAGYSQRWYDYDYTIFKKFIDNNKPIYISASHERKGVHFIIRWGWKYNGHAWVGDGYRIIKQMQKVKVDRGNKGGISYVNRVSSTSQYIHMNWGWGKNNSNQKSNGGWCTYNYFKTPSFSEFKWNKKMITY